MPAEKRNATLHHGKSWWVIPDKAVGFNKMRNFATRDTALAWAKQNGFDIATESQAIAWDNLVRTWSTSKQA